MSSTSPKIHVFINHIYPRRLFVVNGKITDKWINDRFCVAYDGSPIGPMNDGCKCCVNNSVVECKEDGKYGILVCIKDKLSVSDIAHESSHVAACLFNDIGAGFDFDNQEPFAYLVGWAADCINQVVTNKFKD